MTCWLNCGSLCSGAACASREATAPHCHLLPPSVHTDGEPVCWDTYTGRSGQWAPLKVKFKGYADNLLPPFQRKVEKVTQCLVKHGNPTCSPGWLFFTLPGFISFSTCNTQKWRSMSLKPEFKRASKGGSDQDQELHRWAASGRVSGAWSGPLWFPPMEASPCISFSNPISQSHSSIPPINTSCCCEQNGSISILIP